MNSNMNPLACMRPAPANDATTSKQINGATPPRLRVLLLEDDLELAELLGLIFETWGFKPTIAQCGREGLRLLEEQEFRLALVDINLPDTTGFEVIAAALAQGWLRNMKVIFCSAETSDDRMAKVGQFPGTLFVPKPFEMRNLLPLIQRLLRAN